MIAIIFSCALLVSSYTDVCIAKRTWDGKELRPPSLRKPPREALTPGRPQRQTLSQKWTGEVNPDLPGVNLPGVKHLVRHPRMFKPPEANYTIVHSTQEYQEILSQATGHNIYIRFHESLHFVDVGSLRQHMATNIALAPNVTLVLDCQGGAVISDPLQPFPEPNEGSFFDGYGCVWFGSGQGEGSLAAAMRLSDLWLLHPCAVCLFLSLIASYTMLHDASFLLISTAVSGSQCAHILFTVQIHTATAFSFTLH